MNSTSSHTAKIESTWTAPVVVDDIEDTGLHVEIEAPAETRASLAKVAGLRDLSRVVAAFDLTRQGNSVHVSGRVSAKVGQTCVVTLEPIESEIEETVHLVFAPPGAGTPAKVGGELPEPLIGGVIDLGAVASEFLMLGIDPYPRKVGAKFVAPPAGDPGPHPFAALEALKKRSERNQT